MRIGNFEGGNAVEQEVDLGLGGRGRRCGSGSGNGSGNGGSDGLGLGETDDQHDKDYKEEKGGKNEPDEAGTVHGKAVEI